MIKTVASVSQDDRLWSLSGPTNRSGGDRGSDRLGLRWIGVEVWRPIRPSSFKDPDPGHTTTFVGKYIFCEGAIGPRSYFHYLSPYIRPGLFVFRFGLLLRPRPRRELLVLRPKPWVRQAKPSMAGVRCSSSPPRMACESTIWIVNKGCKQRTCTAIAARRSVQGRLQVAKGLYNLCISWWLPLVDAGLAGSDGVPPVPIRIKYA